MNLKRYMHNHSDCKQKQRHDVHPDVNVTRVPFRSFKADNKRQQVETAWEYRLTDVLEVYFLELPKLFEEGITVSNDDAIVQGFT